MAKKTKIELKKKKQKTYQSQYARDLTYIF